MQGVVGGAQGDKVYVVRQLYLYKPDKRKTLRCARSCAAECLFNAHWDSPAHAQTALSTT